MAQLGAVASVMVGAMTVATENRLVGPGGIAWQASDPQGLSSRAGSNWMQAQNGPVSLLARQSSQLLLNPARSNGWQITRGDTLRMGQVLARKVAVAQSSKMA
jgi:hypothetical protein